MTVYRVKTQINYLKIKQIRLLCTTTYNYCMQREPITIEIESTDCKPALGKC